MILHQNNKLYFVFQYKLEDIEKVISRVFFLK